MGFQQAELTYPSPGESLLVVVDANRNKPNVDALDWAIKNIVHPKDTVVVLVVLSEIGKKSSPSCFPYMGIRLSGIWVKLEFSSGPGEMSPSQLEEEIERKREEYQINGLEQNLFPILSFDTRPKKEGRYHLRKDRVYIYGHVACNVAVMKRKGVATLMPSKAPDVEQWPMGSQQIDGVAIISNGHATHHHDENYDDFPEKSSWSPALMPQTPCWFPLSWRTGFPRAFSLSELEEITDSFAQDNIVCTKDERIIYEAIYHETPVLVTRLSANDESAWSSFKILSRVRHRSISNLVGHCCSRDYIYLIRDYPCNGNLELNLQCDESAKNISWKARWCMALGIGAAIRYLHEECADGPIVNLSVSSDHIVFSHDCCAMLGMHKTAKLLEDDTSNENSTENTVKDESLFADVCDYCTFLIELISGKSTNDFKQQGNGQSLSDWALPLLQNGSLSEVMDPRLNDTTDAGVDHMVRAALLCLKNDAGCKLSISEAEQHIMHKHIVQQLNALIALAVAVLALAIAFSKISSPCLSD
ncbi:hypothetical protein LguiA_027084 [Lonicera macranthoides]